MGGNLGRTGEERLLSGGGNEDEPVTVTWKDSPSPPQSLCLTPETMCSIWRGCSSLVVLNTRKIMQLFNGLRSVMAVPQPYNCLSCLHRYFITVILPLIGITSDM